MIKAIIFDCFGVIITDALEHIINELKLKEPNKAEQIVEVVRKANAGILEPMESRLAIAGILGLSYDDYSNNIREEEKRNGQILEHIESLRNKYKIALLSNVMKGGLKLRFSQEELNRYFDVVVESGEIGYAKPQAQAYEITADKLGLRLNECIIIDDREDYCEGALGVGMPAIHYLDFEEYKTEINGYLIGN